MQHTLLSSGNRLVVWSYLRTTVLGLVCTILAIVTITLLQSTTIVSGSENETEPTYYIWVTGASLWHPLSPYFYSDYQTSANLTVTIPNLGPANATFQVDGSVNSGFILETQDNTTLTVPVYENKSAFDIYYENLAPNQNWTLSIDGDNPPQVPYNITVNFTVRPIEWEGTEPPYPLVTNRSINMS